MNLKQSFRMAFKSIRSNRVGRVKNFSQIGLQAPV